MRAANTGRNGYERAGSSPPISTARLVLALASAFLPIVLMPALPFLLPAGVAPPRWIRGQIPLIFTLYAIANLVGLVAVYSILGRRRLRALGVVLRFSRRGLGLAVGGFAAAVALFAAVNPSIRAAGLPVLQGMPSDLTADQAIVLFVAVVLIVPFCEEVLFRSVWYMGLRQRVRPVAAAAAAAAAFAAIHLPYFGIGGMIYITLWALLPISLYAYTGDITASWLMHAINNTFAYVVVPITGLPVPGT